MSVLPKCKNRPLASAFSEPACENDTWRVWGKGDKEVSSLLKPPLSLIGICERETCKEYGADYQNMAGKQMLPALETLLAHSTQWKGLR